MLKKKLLVAALVAAFAAPASAEDLTFSSSLTMASDYLFRGVTQTGKNPTLQGSFDVAHASGLYAGVWGSSISWLGDAGTATKAGTEFDTFVGYSGTASDIGYDVGFLRYNYPGSYGTNLSADTNEIYGALSYSIVTAKMSYSLGDLFGTPNSKGSTYLEASVEYPVENMGITLGAHVGKTTVANNSASDYNDYNFSVSKDVGGYTFGLLFSKESLGSTSTGVLSLSHSM